MRAILSFDNSIRDVSTSRANEGPATLSTVIVNFCTLSTGLPGDRWGDRWHDHPGSRPSDLEDACHVIPKYVVRTWALSPCRLDLCHSRRVVFLDTFPTTAFPTTAPSKASPVPPGTYAEKVSESKVSRSWRSVSLFRRCSDLGSRDLEGLDLDIPAARYSNPLPRTRLSRFPTTSETGSPSIQALRGLLSQIETCRATETTRHPDILAIWQRFQRCACGSHNVNAIPRGAARTSA